MQRAARQCLLGEPDVDVDDGRSEITSLGNTGQWIAPSDRLGGVVDDPAGLLTEPLITTVTLVATIDQ